MKKLIFTLLTIFALTSCTSTSTDTELIEPVEIERTDEFNSFDIDSDYKSELALKMEIDIEESLCKWFKVHNRAKTEVVYNIEYLSSFGTKRNNILLTDTIESAYSIQVIGYEYSYHPGEYLFDRCDWITYRYSYDNEIHRHLIYKKLDGIEPTHVAIVSVRELEYKE